MNNAALIAFLVTSTLVHTPVFAAENAASTPITPANSAASPTTATPKTPDPVTLTETETGFAGSYLASQFARDQGDVDSAIAYIKDTLAKNPERMDLAAQLLSLLVGKGDIEAAMPVAQSIQAAGKPDPLADLLLLLALVKQNDFAAASDKLTRSFDMTNGQLWLPLVDAWIDAGKHSIKQAITIEEMPITVGRAAAVMNYHLALVNAYAGYKDQATLNFADAIDNPETAPLRVMQQLKAFYDKNGKPAQLESILDGYSKAHPEALAALESPVIRPADGIAEVLYSMGSVMQLAGVSNDATIYMQLARYIRPDFTLATFSLADVLFDAKAYARANAVLAAIPANSQYALKAKMRTALTLDRMEQTDAALQLLGTLSKQNPKAVEPLIAKGDLLRLHGRFLEAIVTYDSAIARIGKDPSDNAWAVYFARGSCFERLGKWSNAKADLEKALTLKPDEPNVLNYLGYGMISHNENIDAAKAMLEKALAKSPNDPQIIDSMGWALYLLGDYKGALPYLERAVELLPSDATVNDHLGDLYWRLERKAEARFQWQRALSYSPTDEEEQKINAKLAGGLTNASPAKTASAAADNASPAQ